MILPTVKNVHKGKRHKKKHYFKVGDPVVFKWYGERDYGYISELTFENRTKNAQYSIKSTGHIACIYHTMELDDPDDPYCYISSVLTKSITQFELKKIEEHRNGKHLAVQTKPTTAGVPPSKKITKKATTVIAETVVTPKNTTVNNSELKKAINKQKDFLNGNVDKSFW
jgi:hypothetical protein